MRATPRRSRRRFAAGLLAALGAATCGGAAEEPGGELALRALAPGVWLHTTWRIYEGERIPSHGLVVEDGDGLLLVDSAWGEDETGRLLALIQDELGRPVTAMLSTHHHEDRASGVDLLRARGARVVAHPLAPALVAAQGRAAPDALPGLEEPGSAVRLGSVEVFYPGPAHAVDNVAVWIPGAHVLFGGCAVRPGESSSLGNTADADVEAWPAAIERLRARYGDEASVVVVPGHGEPAGPELLEHNLGLFGRGASARDP